MNRQNFDTRNMGNMNFGSSSTTYTVKNGNVQYTVHSSFPGQTSQTTFFYANGSEETEEESEEDFVIKYINQRQKKLKKEHEKRSRIKNKQNKGFFNWHNCTYFFQLIPVIIVFLLVVVPYLMNEIRYIRNI